jgi:hypothetical protein
MRIFILLLWAHFWRFAPKSGLSAPIPRICPLQILRDFRFNPLRGLKMASMPAPPGNGLRAIFQLYLFTKAKTAIMKNPGAER